MRAVRFRLLAIALSLAGGAWAGGTARAAPAAGLAFSAPSDLAMFAPEVARAVAAGLVQAGVDAGASAGAIAGRIEPMGEERVRLSATIAGRSAVVEGPLEEIDQLAAALAVRLAPMLPQAARHPATPPHPLPAAPPSPRDVHARRSPIEESQPAATPASGRPAALVPVSLPQAPPVVETPATPASPSPAEARLAAASVAAASVAATPEAAPAPASTPAPAPPPPSAPVVAVTPLPPAPAAVTRPPASPAPAAPPPLQPPTAPAAAPVAPPAPAAREAPSAPAARAETGEPLYESLHPAAPPRRPLPRRPQAGVQPLGRALLHVVRTPEGCSSGQWATTAARDVLDRQVFVQTRVTGCGIVARRLAAAEAQQAGVSSVVMASIDQLRFDPVGDRLRPLGRLRVVVVRDGTPVLVEHIDIATQPLASADLERAAYDIAAAGFAQLAGQLQSALLYSR